MSGALSANLSHFPDRAGVIDPRCDEQRGGPSIWGVAYSDCQIILDLRKERLLFRHFLTPPLECPRLYSDKYLPH